MCARMYQCVVDRPLSHPLSHTHIDESVSGVAYDA